MLKEMILEVPTYDPNGQGDKEYDHSRPGILTLIPCEGLRVVMGADSEGDAPDVTIERAVDESSKPLWRVFVHANEGGPEVIIEFTEDKMTVYDANKVNHPEPLFICERG
jgi:hypothetical protein